MFLFCSVFINFFWFALQLDKAFQISPSIGEDYVKKLREEGLVPKGIESPEEVAGFLQRNLAKGDFYYRYAPTEQFDLD
jgi:hypothetical protein